MTHPSDYLEEIAKSILGQPSDEAMCRTYEKSLGVPEQAAWDFRRTELAKLQADQILAG